MAERPVFIDLETITLTKNGVWLSDGHEITHEQQLKAFARSLKRDSEGYYLSIGRDFKRVVVEDTPYFVARIEGDSKKGFEVFLNDESHEPLDPSTLEYAPGRLVCKVKGGTEPARFLPASYYEFLKELREDAASYFVEVGARRITLAKK